MRDDDDIDLMFGTGESGIISLEHSARDVLVALGTRLAQEHEIESYSLVVTDKNGVEFNLLIGLDSHPGMVDVSRTTH